MDLIRTVENIEDVIGCRWWLIVLLLLVSASFPWLLAIELVLLVLAATVLRRVDQDAGGAA